MEMTKLMAINNLLTERSASDTTVYPAAAGSLFSPYWLSVVLLFILLTGGWIAMVRFRQYRDLNLAIRSELEGEKICMAQLSEEKEFLIREIHHRVKNNLQIMMSLLNMQSTYLTGEEATTAIRNSCHRLFAISLVHQKLYQSDSLSDIDVPVYLRELGQHLQYEYRRSDHVTINIEADPVCLDVSSAIPLGLIVHEALSNAFRHGFHDGRKGSVTVYLHSEDELQYLLQISDDGVGFPENPPLKEGDSLGTSLMNGLSGQLRGKLAIQNNNGVTVSLVFPKDSGTKTGLLPNLKDTNNL